MAKTIKFNLIMDNNPVRTIADLQENFSIEDALKYFKNGLLMKWLSVRGFDGYYKKISEIDKNSDDITILRQLIKIFDIELDDTKIEMGVEILKYIDEEKERNAKYRENSIQPNQIIEDYHDGYSKLCNDMIINNDNMAILKADAVMLQQKYLHLFELDYKKLYMRLAEQAPKAIFAILFQSKLREFWLEDLGIKSRLASAILSAAKEILGDDLKIEKRNTQGMWDPIERKENKLMIISVDGGSFVKNAGEFSEKLGADDINGKFLLFNGLEYQSLSTNKELLYMEI